jgi:non-ribosomal peptide synthase protein (TIGR01720 family)
VVGAAAQASPWLVFAEPGPLHQGLVSRLEQLGRDVVCVFPGGGFGGCTDGGYVIDPAAREDYDRLLDALVAGNGIPDKVVHLWAARPLPDEADLGAGLDRGFYSLLHLAQALTERRPDDAWDLTAVTSRVHEVSAGEPLSPATAAALGVCRVLGLEHPRVTCRNVDLSPDAVRDGGAPLVEALMTEVDHPARDAVVALRGGQRWVQSFEPTPLAAADDRPDLLREGGTYLILGGLGAVGLTVARYLARIARANLVLAGRSGLPDEDAWGEWLEAHAPDDATSRRIRAVEALQEAGARIRVRATEVADEDALRSLVEEIEQDFGRLDGVIHAAGAEKTGSIIAQATRLDCEEQLRAKLPGLVALARVLEDRPPDFCLLCSSLSSILGASGFVAYTAAHAFMDAFAQQQSQRDIGPRWITVNWDNWNAHGIDRASLAPGIAEFLMSAEEGTDALGRVLCTNALTQVAVSTGDLVGRVERLAQRDPEQVAESETAATARHPRPDLDALFEAPRDDAERTLAGIWEALLGIDGIGIHDNFFELGGDSVVNIQIISRANQAGLKLTPKQVFEHQTIAELAALAGTGEGVDAEQGLVSGTLPPTPVQRWFLEADLASPDHFNQARVLELRPPADPDAIREALRRLLRHHDALRLRVVPGADPPELRVAGPEQDVPLDAIDGTGLSESELDSLVEARATELQPRFDLVEGPLVRAAWFDAGPERAGRLLLIIHHLVVDEVSWPMLLEDLETAYGQVRSGQEVELPPKTTSFRAWSLRLHEYAQTAAATRDLDTWVRQGEKPLRPLPVDHEDGPNSAGSTDVVHIELGAGDTQALLQDAHRAYNTQTHDLLMAALARAFARWTGESRLHVLLEGHGREAPFEGVDLTRTVGWFTTLYPAVIEVEPEADAGRVIPSVKEQLRALPRQGMSYGVLRYLSPDTEVRDALAAQPRPQAVFLYLGRAETAASDDRPFRVVPQRVGPLRSADTERGELLEISARVVDGRLGVAWTYSRNVHRRETIEALSGYFVHELSSLIAHCRAAERTEATPADFTAARLSQSDLDKITRRLGRGESGAR